MAKTVKIRTLVALAGTDISLAAGDEYEVDEAVAKARVEEGLAEYVEPPARAKPAEQRATATRGARKVETTASKPRERRPL